jgi:hypothetical protein
MKFSVVLLIFLLFSCIARGDSRGDIQQILALQWKIHKSGNNFMAMRDSNPVEFEGVGCVVIREIYKSIDVTQHPIELRNLSTVLLVQYKDISSIDKSKMLCGKQTDLHGYAIVTAPLEDVLLAGRFVIAFNQRRSGTHVILRYPDDEKFPRIMASIELETVSAGTNSVYFVIRDRSGWSYDIELRKPCIDQCVGNVVRRWRMQ